MMQLMKPQEPTIVLCETGETGIASIQSYSPFCLKVHRALGAAGLAYESRRGAPRDFLGLNPTGEVPVLLIDDEVVRDSTAIVARVAEMAERAGGPSLLPKDARARAEAWLWEDYADRALNGFVVAARWDDDRNWPLVREAYFGGAPWVVRKLVAPFLRKKLGRSLVARDVTRAGSKALWDEYRRVLDALEARAPYEGFWCSEDAPTVADVSLFGQLQSLRTPLTAAQGRELKLRPALTDWLDRVDAATQPGRSTPLRVAAAKSEPRFTDLTIAREPARAVQGWACWA
jgi:glutathione S-transferase